MASFARWIGYIAGFIALVQFPFQLARWQAVRRLYGRIPWSLIWQMRVYAQKNKMLRIQLWIVRIAFLIIVVPVFVDFIGSDLLGVSQPAPAGSRALRVPALMVVVWQLEQIAGFLVPPAGLLLGTAKSVNVHLVAVLHRMTAPNRVVSLLEIKEHIFPPFVQAVMFNNLRTVNGYEWRTVVHHLMDVVPLILVDTAVSTEYVDAELERIKRYDLEYKVIAFSSAPYGLETNALEAGGSKVVEEAEELGKELTPKVMELLKHPTDITRRWNAQLTYNAMIKSVPNAVRFSSDINGMLVKAHYILAWTMERYLLDCKELSVGKQPACLIEDIPSRVTQEEEESYLRHARGFDEVRGISFSALDLARQTQVPKQAFNIANAHNKIGKCARFSHDWEAAFHHLGEAIEMFRQMSAGSDVPTEDFQQIQQELADAYFLRGEAHMVCYRQTDSAAQRESALSDFRASIVLDQEVGRDSGETAERIASI